MTKAAGARIGGSWANIGVSGAMIGGSGAKIGGSGAYRILKHLGLKVVTLGLGLGLLGPDWRLRGKDLGSRASSRGFFLKVWH